MKPKYYAIIAGCLMVSTTLFSQIGLTVHAGPAFAIGDFGKDDDDIDAAGYAAAGFGFGATYVYPVSDIGIGLFAELDVIFNGIRKSEKDYWEDNYPSYDFTHWSYITVPLTIGGQYTYELNDQWEFFGRLGLMISPVQVTKWKWEDPNDFDYIETYKLNTKVGAKFGVGAVMNDRWEFAVTILTAGKRDIEGDFEEGPDSGSFEYELKVGHLMLTGGYRF